MKLSLPLVAACLALTILSSPADADDWQWIDDCRLIENEANDGDSFHAEVLGKETILRLYFVDSPEAESGGYVTERVGEQAEHFGISESASVEMGKKAAAFTRAVLSRPFKVLTRGQDARGASKLPRQYAFVRTFGEEDLGEMLVSRGLARSFGEGAAPPGESASELRAKYDELEDKARKERVGAWGDDAAKPTKELGGSEKTKKAESDEGSSLGLPSLSDVLSSDE